MLERLVGCGYSREDQVFERGQFAARGGILDVYPATEERAVRVELFGDEVESLRWFSTFTQRSLAEADAIEIAPAAELDPTYRELAELAASEEGERPDVAEVLPVDSFRTFLELIPDDAAVVLAAEEELRPALSDHWQDVTTQPPLRRRASPLPAARAGGGGARQACGQCACRPCRRTSHTAFGRRPPTPPPARSRTPSPSSRSWGAATR